jgi:hypothetical protein
MKNALSVIFLVATLREEAVDAVLNSLGFAVAYSLRRYCPDQVRGVDS